MSTWLRTLLAATVALAACSKGLAAEPPAPGDPQAPLAVVYFYSPTCAQCQKARQAVDAAEKKYAGSVRVERHSIAETEGLELMFAFEDRYGVKAGSPPKVFVGGRCLPDREAIETQLDAAIREELERRRPAVPAAPALPPAAPSPVEQAAAPAPPAGPDAEAVASPVAPSASAAIPESVRSEFGPSPAEPPPGANDYAFADVTPVPADASFAPHAFGYVPPSQPLSPQFAGGPSPDALAMTIEVLPAAEPSAAAPASPVDAGAIATPAPGQALAHRFMSFRLGAILAAGLIDGVNPCAFATIVFLLSAVAYLGKTRREVAVVGVAFTAAVFVTYMLLGLGLMLAIKAFAVETGLTRAITYGIAALTFGLAGWSLYDGVRAVRSGKTPQHSLGLPPRIRNMIHRVIKGGFKTRNLVIGSLAVGFLVSLLESFCTGQVYVPTIMIMLREPGGHRLTAVAYLLLYNLMFILPLAAIMVGAYYGVRSERLAAFMRKHLAAMKFALAGLFAGLGLVLLLT